MNYKRLYPMKLKLLNLGNYYILASKKILRKQQHLVSNQKKSFCEQLSEISNIIRKDIKEFNHKTQYVGHCEEDALPKALPKALLQLMSSILEGDCNNISRGALSTAQIALFNFRSKPKDASSPQTSSKRRHIYRNPLVTYIGLLLHNRYRCKDMIYDLNFSRERRNRKIQCTKSCVYFKVETRFSHHHNCSGQY